MCAVNEVSDPSYLCPGSCSKKKNFQPAQSPIVSLLEAA